MTCVDVRARFSDPSAKRKGSPSKAQILDFKDSLAFGPLNIIIKPGPKPLLMRMG